MPLPEVQDSLTQSLESLGFCASNGMGLEPVSFTEIQAWARLTGKKLLSWQAQALRTMSQAFVSGYHAEVPPFEPLETRKLLTTAQVSQGG